MAGSSDPDPGPMLVAGGRIERRPHTDTHSASESRQSPQCCLALTRLPAFRPMPNWSFYLPRSTLRCPLTVGASPFVPTLRT